MKRGYFIFLFLLLVFLLFYSEPETNTTKLGCARGGSQSGNNNDQDDPIQQSEIPKTTVTPECFETDDGQPQQSPPSFVKYEELTSNSNCPNDYEQTIEFTDGSGNTIRHCVKTVDEFVLGGEYVTDSYLEIFDSVQRCRAGGDGLVWFNDTNNNVVYLCVERTVPDNEEQVIKDVAIVESCPSWFVTSEIELEEKTIVHCISTEGASDKSAIRQQAIEEQTEEECCVEGCLGLTKDQCEKAKYCDYKNKCMASRCEKKKFPLPGNAALEYCGRIILIKLDENGKPISAFEGFSRFIEIISEEPNGICVEYKLTIGGISDEQCEEANEYEPPAPGSGEGGGTSGSDENGGTSLFNPPSLRVFTLITGPCGQYNSLDECKRAENNTLKKIPKNCEDKDEENEETTDCSIVQIICDDSGPPAAAACRDIFHPCYIKLNTTILSALGLQCNQMITINELVSMLHEPPSSFWACYFKHEIMHIFQCNEETEQNRAQSCVLEIEAFAKGCQCQQQYYDSYCKNGETTQDCNLARERLDEDCGASNQGSVFEFFECLCDSRLVDQNKCQECVNKGPQVSRDVKVKLCESYCTRYETEIDCTEI